MSEPQRKPPGGLDWRKFTPEDSPKTPLDVLADPARKALSSPDLQPGDLAIDFELPVFDFSTGVRQETGRHFHLAKTAGERPVALIFGSYT